ncbi:MAG: radical SAM protein [Anaerolineae bacterium]|nr:radical SAM protein [Anaerolineae bacterium]
MHLPILLLACYELGHQPLSLAWPQAVLREAGVAVVSADLSVVALPRETAVSAPFVGIAVPMHTALRLGVQVARRVRRLNPSAHICFYGMYAWLNRDYLLDGLADSVIAGEYERPLLDLVQDVLAGGQGTAVSGITTAASQNPPNLERLNLPTPDRSGLPALNQYARYEADGDMVLAGYVEASRGCLHTCQHCPVVPVYNGRFFIIPHETVMADIRQQAAAGAKHITFGDPDFLNGPGHALKITQALHAEFPQLTFDFTTKVEHILKHRDLFPTFKEYGATFVISAFEATNETILARLNKGHTVAEMETAVAILKEAGLAVQPTWMPFTPWTSLEDYLNLLAWIRTQDLIPNVPIVQLCIRMLVPPESALLNHPDVLAWRGPLSAENFTYQWQHPDPCMDELQQQVAALAESAGNNHYANFAAVEKAAYRLMDAPMPHWLPPTIYEPPPPRLTEDWFC